MCVCVCKLKNLCVWRRVLSLHHPAHCSDVFCPLPVLTFRGKSELFLFVQVLFFNLFSPLFLCIAPLPPCLLITFLSSLQDNESHVFTLTDDYFLFLVHFSCYHLENHCLICSPPISLSCFLHHHHTCNCFITSLNFAGWLNEPETRDRDQIMKLSGCHVILMTNILVPVCISYLS